MVKPLHYNFNLMYNLHTYFVFWKATKPTFLARTEIRRHFAIFGRTIRLVKLLAFVLLSGGSFKIDISTRITSVEVIVLKISGQTIAL